MRVVRVLLVVGLLAGARTSTAQSPTPQSPAPTSSPAPAPAAKSYRAYTIAIDAVAVTAMAVGAYGLGHNWNLDLSGDAFALGTLTALFATPLVHTFNDGRGGTSLLLRVALGIGGAAIGLRRTPSDLGDEIVGMMTWSTAGIAIAGTIDAIAFHKRPRTWTPAVTPGAGGAQVGILGAF